MNYTLDMRKVRERTTREVLAMPVCTRPMQALGTILALLAMRKKKP
jgi:hypothetical protein